MMAFMIPAEKGPGLSLTMGRRSHHLMLLGAFGATHSKSKNLIQDPKRSSSAGETDFWCTLQMSAATRLVRNRVLAEDAD